MIARETFKFKILMEHILQKYQQVPVTEHPNQVQQTPLVSVCIQAYNQCDYIRQCLDGVLSQETNFEYEILIGEDGSKDGTREICIEYADKYPQSIKLFLHSRENNITIDGTPTGRFNILYNMLSARGTYVAICDGDDFWFDQQKLQKQYDFLKAHPECVMVHTNYYLRAQAGPDQKYSSSIKPKYWPKREQLWLNNYIGTLTVLINRQALLKVINTRSDQLFNWLMLDYLLWLRLSELGRIGFLNTLTSVYNIHSNSMSSFDDMSRHIKFLKSGLKLQETVLPELVPREEQKSIKVLGYKTYARKRFRLAVKSQNKPDAIQYYFKMRFITRLNPLNICKMFRVMFFPGETL